MQFTQFSSVLVASLAATAVAAPAAQAPNPDGGPTPPGAPPTHPYSGCIAKEGSSDTEWGIYIVNTTMPSSSGSWAGGLYDQVNKNLPRCHTKNWQAQIDSNTPQGVAVTFQTATNCQQYEIVNSIQAASKQWVDCAGDTFGENFDEAGKVWGTLSAAIGQAANIIGMFAKK